MKMFMLETKPRNMQTKRHYNPSTEAEAGIAWARELRISLGNTVSKRELEVGMVVHVGNPSTSARSKAGGF